jgi:hypothetical protein
LQDQSHLHRLLEISDTNRVPSGRQAGWNARRSLGNERHPH